MIAVHLEPEGLDPSAIPLHTSEHEKRVKKAVRGSRRLRDAILAYRGLKPPIEIIRRPELCPTCFAPVGPQRTMIANIQRVVASYYGLHLSAMTSAERRQKVSHPRQVAMFLATELTQHSIAEIGRRFKRDHTTVLHALKVVPARSEANAQEAFDVSLLRERLGA